MNRVQKIHCNSILPLVFNDSMSYYEQLSKLVYTVNQLINTINSTIDDKIADYISNHFDDLMMNAIYDAKTETIILSWRE